jgi:hypothetical protein
MPTAVAAALGILLTLVTAGAARGQDTQEATAERVLAALQQFEAKPDLSLLGALTGLWRTDHPELPMTSITHLGGVLLHYTVNTRTGALGTMGVGEQREGQWRGWWSVVCKGCCPGVSWWDRATFTRAEGQGAQVRITTKKMDPKRCVLGEEPDVVELRLTQVNAFSFSEIAPGKLIHLVAAPAVGPQAAQCKAAVRPRWSLAGTGVATVTVAAPGRMLVDRQPRVTGDVEFVTDRSGTYRFLLVGWNSAGKPLHLEFSSIQVPTIPGTGC